MAHIHQPRRLIAQPASLAGVATVTGSAASTDAYGIATYAVQALRTGINNDGLAFSDDHGGNSAAWMTDASGGFGRITYAAGGTAGFRISLAGNQNRILYIRYGVRRNQNLNSKECKAFGFGYPAQYSNFTFGCNTGGYSGVTQGVSYSDKPGGGDIDVQYNYGAFPTLTGGSAFTAAAPTKVTDIASTEHIDGSTWDLHEKIIVQNTDGNADGEYIALMNGVVVTHLTNMTNCRAGGQGFIQVDLAGYSPNVGLYEDYRDVNIAIGQRPVGRGF